MEWCINKRRDFLKWSVAGSVTASLPSFVFSHKETLKKGPSIIQGATDNSNTQFSVVHKESEKWFFIAVEKETGFGQWPDSQHREIFPGSDQVISKVYFSGLDFKQKYYFRVVDAKSSLVDEREFGLIDMQKKDLKFAICSCMDDARHRPDIWEELQLQNPDMIFFVGDSFYADYESEHDRQLTNPAILWQRSSESRRVLQIYYSKKLIPIIATWDDHDFGQNNSNMNYPYVLESQDNFLKFFAQNEAYCSYLTNGPGVSSAFKWGEQLFILMDCRSFRQPTGSTDRYAHWGKDQEDWLFELANEHTGPIYLMNGSQLFVESAFREGLANDHQVHFKNFKKRLETVNSRFIFVSGDIHFSEISKIYKKEIGYDSLEVTSSAIHSSNFGGLLAWLVNPRRIRHTILKNFVIIQSTAHGYGAKIQVSSHSPGRVNFKENFVV